MWFGIDRDLETSLGEYNLIAQEVENNVYEFIYFDTYTAGYQICTMSRDEVESHYTDLSDSDKERVLSCFGVSEEDFLGGSVVQIISDLIGTILTVWDIFGVSYYKGMTHEEVLKYIEEN